MDSQQRETAQRPRLDHVLTFAQAPSIDAYVEQYYLRVHNPRGRSPELADAALSRGGDQRGAASLGGECSPWIVAFTIAKSDPGNRALARETMGDRPRAAADIARALALRVNLMLLPAVARVAVSARCLGESAPAG